MPWVKNTIAAAGVALLAGGSLLAGAAAADAAPAGKAKISVIIVRFPGHSLTLNTHHVRAGRVLFRLPPAKGGHGIQVARLRKGYSFAQASQDIGAAFSGNVPAVQRVDKHVYFRGGVSTTAKRGGRASMVLQAGTYYVLDNVGTAYSTLTVTGSVVHRRTVHTTAAITMYSYGFKTPKSMPHAGTLALANAADQPHFTTLLHVKTGTTAKQVGKFLSPTATTQPKWLLKANTSSGTVSPGQKQTMTYNLPKGEYVVACFWPDYFTGMPHAYMGMWSITTLN